MINDPLEVLTSSEQVHEVIEDALRHNHDVHPEGHRLCKACDTLVDALQNESMSWFEAETIRHKLTLVLWAAPGVLEEYIESCKAYRQACEQAV